MKWENKGRELEHISQVIQNSNSKYYIWGAGVFGESFCEEFRGRIHVIGFLDSNPAKQGKEFCGLPVYSPETFKKKEENVKTLVSAGWTKDIFKELRNMGYEKNRDFFHIDEFMSLYMMSTENQLYLPNLTYIITEKCTFKCKHCSGLYPYYEKPQNHATDEIMDDLGRYFMWVDKVNVLGICGGDAMLHPEFKIILKKIGEKYYKKKIFNIEVYTNAVIVPDKETLNLFKKYNVFYRFTDYGEEVNPRQKIPEIITMLEENGIRYDHVKFGAWYDSGYPQATNGIKGENNLINFFEACDRRSCQVLMEGKLLYCGVAKNFADIGYCALDESDYFDLTAYDEGRKKELMEYMLGYSEKGYLSCCRKCNGGQNVNKKQIPVGVQL